MPTPAASSSGTAGLEVAVVGLVDGSTVEGSIKRFVPFMPFVRLDAGADGTPVGPIKRETVAWVGFRLADGVEPDPPAPESVGLTVALKGGRSFRVWAAAGARENALGFSGQPVDPAEGLRTVFLFREQILDIQDVSVQPVAAEGSGGDSIQELDGVDLVELDDLIELDPAVLEPAPDRRIRLGDLLVERQLISQSQLLFALKLQREGQGQMLGEVLLEQGLVSEVDLFRTIALRYGLAYVDLDEIPINPDAVAAVDPRLLQRFCCIPLDVTDHTCLVATTDPAEGVASALSFALNRQVSEVIATPSQINALRKVYLVEAPPLAAEPTTVSAPTPGKEGRGRTRPMPKADDEQSVVQLVEQIFTDAAAAEASDIHIEPYGDERNTVVRFRADGECYLYQELPPAIWRSVVSRIKILAKLDISERRLPQDGKIQFDLDDTRLEFRVATLPTAAGNEDVVLRLLARSDPFPIDKMGLSEHNLAALRDAIHRPYGLVLCVGPTGSGKTTTLHSALGAINTPERKIWTAEDPVEITQIGIRQVQVDAKIGLTFARAMRAFLRADPDVVMIGEMRDPETASIAVEASLTGHLVLSTLHTNTAPETVTRLLDMGLDPFTFADSLVAVIAQRLARRLCPSCRVLEPASEAEVAQLRDLYGPTFDETFKVEGLALPRPRGCAQCGDSGFRGRVALHELLSANDGIADAIRERSPVSVIRERAVAGGMKTLLQDGIAKVIAGNTGLKQVLAQCSR